MKLSSGIEVAVGISVCTKGIVTGLAVDVVGNVVVAIFISVVEDSGVTITTFVVVGADVVLIDMGVTMVVSSFSVVTIFMVVGLLEVVVGTFVVAAAVMGMLVVRAVVTVVEGISVGAGVVSVSVWAEATSLGEVEGVVTKLRIDIRVDRVRLRKELSSISEVSLVGSIVVEASAGKVLEGGITVTDFCTYLTGREAPSVVLLLVVVELAAFCGGFVITTSLSFGSSVVSITLCSDDIELSILSITDLGVPKATSCDALWSFFGIFCIVVLGTCVMSFLVLTVVVCCVVVVAGVVDVVVVLPSVVDDCVF